MSEAQPSTTPPLASPDANPAASQAAPTSAPILSGRRLASATLVVMLFFVLSRVTGLAREVVIGAHFGTSLELDAYLAAFRLPDLLFQLVAGGALGSAFIPTFAAYWARSQQAEAWLLFSRVLNVITLILIGIAALLMVLAGPLVQWVIAPGFAPEQQAITTQLMRWMLVSTVVFGGSGLIMGALNATQHFLLPAAAPVFYNLAIILGAWLLTPAFGIFGLVIGVVAGAIVHLLVQLPGLWQVRARYTLSLDVADAGVREVVRLMGPRVLGLFFVQMHFLVNTILASGLASGSLSALNYAWLLMLLPQGIFAQSIATAIFPTFAAQVSTGQMDALRHTFGQILRIILFFTIPAALVLYLLRVPLIVVLFQRREFTAESTALVSYALQFYAIGLIAHAIVEIAVRAFYALHDTWTPVLVGVGAMILNIGLSFWWVRVLGHGGLALANSIATTLEMVLLIWLLRRQIGGFAWRQFAASIGRQGVAALVMGVAIWFWLRWQPVAGASTIRVWVITLGGIALAGAVYLAMAFLLRSPELQPALAILRRRR